MSKRSPLDEKLAALKAAAAKEEAARIELEKVLQDARKEAETYLPKLREEVAAIDAKITELQQTKSGYLEQMKLLGEKVGKAGKGKPREGGMADKLKELMRGVGVGGTLTKKDIEEHLGSVSGYVGMCIGAQIDAGNLQRTTAGTYKVTGVA